jgi:cytochrome c553
MSGHERMLRAALAGAALLGWIVAWGAETSNAAGRQIAERGTASGVPACTSCHGPRGEGAGAFPRLAGTSRAYLLEQLDAFGAGTRQNAIMQPFVQKMTPAERTAAASYFASLPPPPRGADRDATPTDAGAWLATRGRWADQVPACAQCHGPGGGGVGANFPPLAGQPADYIAAQLKAWRAGTRPPGPLGLMQDVAKRLTDADVTAVSTYYASLGTAGKAAPATKEQRR